MKPAIISLWTLIALLTASAASALTFNATASTTSGNPLNALILGDEITINIRMVNPSGQAIYGIGAGVQGWDESVVTLVSAQMNDGPYLCTTASCAQGLTNSLALPADLETGNFSAGPSDVQIISGVGNYIPLVQSISISPHAGDGSRDPGLDGVVNGLDAQFRLVFRVVGGGITVLNIGTNGNPILGNVVVLAGGATEPAINANVVITYLGPPIPEPGSAILLGLGLAGLATVRRR